MPFRPPVLLALSALVLSVLAGCASAPTGDDGAQADFDALGLEATATTGVIRGVVVDSAVRPVAGVHITATGPGGSAQQAQSNPDGAFGFSSLPPGDYFLLANKSGYIATQQSAVVVAGVAEPAIVKVVLAADPTTLPFYEAQVLNGFIQCSVRPMILAQQCGITDEDVVHAEYPLARAPDFIQSEMIWESTQAFGDELSLSIRCLPNTDPAEKCPEGQRGIARSEGKSPQVARINRTLIDTWALGVDPLVIDLFAFGRSDLDVYNESTVDGAQEPVTGKPCLDWSGVIFPPGTCIRATGPGVMVNQRVDVFTHIFYGFQPAETWQFSVDGAPVVPA